MITTIRPYQIFELASGQHVTIPIPPRRGSEGGAPSLLETFLLIAAARHVHAKNIFEFGTCRGTTAYNLALNTNAHIYTMDLGEELPESHPDDARYTRLHLGAPVMDYEPLKHRVTQLHGDSKRADFTRYADSMDMVFVDGGHDPDTVACDTRNAFAMVRHPGVIAWHDYGEPMHPGIKCLLEGSNKPIYHVADTVLAFWFTQPVI